MKFDKLIFGAVIIVWGIIEFIAFWSMGYFGPIGALIVGIPTIIAGLILALLGSIQSKVDENRSREKTLVIFYVIITVIISMVSLLLINSYYIIIGLSLLLIGILLLTPSKKGKRRTRKVGLILSALGGIIYLILGLIFVFLFSSVPAGAFGIPLSSTGAIALIGTIIGVKEKRIGGIIILLSIPISILIELIFTFNPLFPYLSVYLLMPPISLLVIIGGILCLRSSDIE